MDANRVKLLPSSPRDGRSLAQLLNEALLEHDRQVSELRVELARMQGIALSPAMALGGPMLDPAFSAPRFPPQSCLPSTEKKDIEVQTQELLTSRSPRRDQSSSHVPAEAPFVPHLGLDKLFGGHADVAPEGSAAQQQGGPPPEAVPAAAPKEQEQPKSQACSPNSPWNEAPSGGEDRVDVEEFAEDMPASRTASDGMKMKKSLTSLSLSLKGHRYLWNQIEQASTALILTNTLFLVVQLQFTGYLAGSFLGVTSPGPFRDDSVRQVFDLIEVGFTVAFALEFAVRLAKNGRQTFYRNRHCEYISVIDAVVVLESISHSVAAYIFNADTINMSFCRPLRFVRLLRLPSIRYGERFAKLRLLMTTIVRSTMSLFWSMFFLWAVMLFGAIFLCQSTANAYYDETIEESVRLWMYEHYGTVARSCYTIFELTFSGGWPNYARPLVENVSPLWAIFFVVYITFIVFAVFRIVSALFIKETMAVAAEDESTAVQEAERKREQLGAKMAALFQEADESGDGQLTLQELQVCVNEESFATVLGAMGFTAKECIELFEVIDAGGDGNLSAQEFVSGMVHVKAGVRPQDIMRILGACNLMVKDMHQHHAALREILNRQAPQ